MEEIKIVNLQVDGSQIYIESSNGQVNKRNYIFRENVSAISITDTKTESGLIYDIDICLNGSTWLNFVTDKEKADLFINSFN